MGLLGDRLIVVLDTNLLDGNELAKLFESVDTRTLSDLCVPIVPEMKELHSDFLESSDLGDSDANDTLLFRVGSEKFWLPPIFVSEFATEIIDCSMFVREFCDASRQTFAGSLEFSRLIFNRCFNRFSSPELGDS